MKKQKIITICSSVAFYRQVLEIEKELKKLGFKVIVPKTARVMKRTNNFEVSHYKTWYKDKAAYDKKRSLMLDHFKKIQQGDMVLVLNLEKNGVLGYIGGNVLMEMAVALEYKKPIYIYNDIPENLSIAEEIYGVIPIFINGDLSQIKR